MLKYVLVFAGLLCETPSIAGPVLSIDNSAQHLAPGEIAFFSGSVAFDTFMPFGAEPALSPVVPAGFSFSPALALAGAFGPGEVYSGPLFLIHVPQDAMPQVYLAMATVGGTSNAVAVTLTIHAVPEPSTFGPTVGVAVAAVLHRKLRRGLR